jgi:hypothetical protein
MVRRGVVLVGGAFLLVGLSVSAQQSLSERIGRTDPAKYRHYPRRHGGAPAGMHVMTLCRVRAPLKLEWNPRPSVREMPFPS